MPLGQRPRGQRHTDFRLKKSASFSSTSIYTMRNVLNRVPLFLLLACAHAGNEAWSDNVGTAVKSGTGPVKHNCDGPICVVDASPEIGFYNLTQSSERMLDSRTRYCPRFLLSFSCLTPVFMAVDPHSPRQSFGPHLLVASTASLQAIVMFLTLSSPPSRIIPAITGALSAISYIISTASILSASQKGMSISSISPRDRQEIYPLSYLQVVPIGI